MSGFGPQPDLRSSPPGKTNAIWSKRSSRSEPENWPGANRRAS